METATIHPYIVKNKEILNGEPIIKSTRTPVRAIVEYWRMGETPESIIQILPHLVLSQIFDALSYYYDNQKEIQNYIQLNSIPSNKIYPILKK